LEGGSTPLLAAGFFIESHESGGIFYPVFPSSDCRSISSGALALEKTPE
jgi:hypothetical protein